MKSYDYEAVVYDGEIYCNQCLPKGVGIESEDVSPIFADSEWDEYPVCCHCGGIHDYVGLTDYGWRQQKIAGCFCGLRGLEIVMTVEDALSASHQGSCDDDVAALLRRPEIAAQFDAMDANDIRAALEECGAWTEEELADDHENRLRALWIAACDIRENYRS